MKTKDKRCDRNLVFEVAAAREVQPVNNALSAVGPLSAAVSKSYADLDAVQVRTATGTSNAYYSDPKTVTLM